MIELLIALFQQFPGDMVIYHEKTDTIHCVICFDGLQVQIFDSGLAYLEWVGFPGIDLEDSLLLSEDSGYQLYWIEN